MGSACSLGTLHARFDGWRGRRFALLRSDAEYLVLPHDSRFREDPLLLGRGVVGSVRESGALLSTYTLRFTQPCDHLPAAGLLGLVALRAGRTIAVGNGEPELPRVAAREVLPMASLEGVRVAGP